MRIAGARWAAMSLAVGAAVAAWQAFRLESWGYDGPGPGLFPQIVALVAIALAVIVFIAPGEAAPDEDGDSFAPVEPPGAVERQAFWVYAIGLAGLAVGTLYVGFAVTAFLLSTLLARFAEGRSWRAAVAFGAIMAGVGLLCFGWLLGVNLPEGAVDRAFYALLR